MPRILVVDDEPGMRQVISKILIPLGYEIIGTDEGARAVQITKEQNPDAVLLDIRLADMDSSDIVTGLKNIRSDLPIIVLSGFGDVDAAVELVKLGAFDYISKPFKVNDFVSIVNKALAKTGHDTSSPAGQPFSTSARKTQRQAETFEPAAAMSAVKRPRSNALKISVAAAVFVLVSTCGIFAWQRYINTPKDEEFRITYSNPSGICFGEKSMWVSDWAGETVYRHSPGPELKIAAAYKTQDLAPTGIAFDGKNIWTSSPFEQKINKHRLDPSLSIEASFKSPGPSPSGLYFDGHNLWSVDYQQGKIYKHKAANPSETEASFDIPAQNPCGMFINGGYAYIADGKTNRIYKLSADTFFLASVLEVPGFEGQKKHIASVAFDGISVWACASGVDRLYRYRMSSLKPVRF